MNRPEKVGEPSMEEILASIRQIIADAPSENGALPAIEANPLVPQGAGGALAAAGAQPDAAPPSMPPLLDRLKKGTLPPTSPFGSRRPLTFEPDQDLADMFDAHDAPPGAEAAPKPAPRAMPDMGAPASPAPAADATPGPDAAPALAAHLSVPTPGVPPPFGSSSPAPEAPAARPFGFPSLRKSSFFPPEAKQPVLPALPDAPPSEEAKAVSSGGVATAENAGGVEEALKRLSGFGSLVPGELASGSAAAPASPFGVPSRAAATPAAGDAPSAPGLSLSVDPVARGAPPAAPAPLAPSALAASSSPPPSPVFAAAERAAFPDLSDQPVRADTASGMTEAVRPLPSFAPAAPFAASPAVRASDATAMSARGAATPLGGDADPSVAAAQALDALAQGLAASAAASAVGATVTASPTPVALTSVATVPDVAAGHGGGPQAASAPAPTSPRTLEDMVADMVRPMLQQWVADNMPRIIERALKAEVGKIIKPPAPSSGA